MKNISVCLFFLISQIAFSQMELIKFIPNYIDTSTDFRNQVTEFFYNGKKPKHDVEFRSFIKQNNDLAPRHGLNVKTDITDSFKSIINSHKKRDYIVCKYSIIADSIGECEVYVINYKTIPGDPFLFCNFLVQFNLSLLNKPKIDFIKRHVM